MSIQQLISESLQEKMALQKYMQQQEIMARERSGANALDFARAKETPLEGASQRQLRDAQGNLLGAQTNATNVDASLAPALAQSEIGLRAAQGTNFYANARNTNFQTDSGVADFNDPNFANGALSALGLPTLRAPAKRPLLSAPSIGAGSPLYKLPAFSMPKPRQPSGGFEENEFGVKTRRSSLSGQGGMIEIR